MRVTYGLALIALLVLCCSVLSGAESPQTNLFSWITAQNGTHKGVTIPGTKGYYHKFSNLHATFTKPGLYATENIPENTDILAIPGSTVLHVDAPHPTTDLGPPIIDIQFQTLITLLRTNNVTDQYALLALRLAHERYKVEKALPSLFTPLVQSLMISTVSPIADWANTTTAKYSPLSLLSLSPASPLYLAREQHIEMQQSVFSLLSSLIDGKSYQDVDIDLAELLDSLTTNNKDLPKEAAEQLLKSVGKDGNETKKLSFPANPFTELFADIPTNSSTTETHSSLSGAAFTESLYTWAYNTALTSSMDIFPEYTQEFASNSGNTPKSEPILCIVPFLNVINHSNPPHSNAEIHLVYHKHSSSSSSSSSSSPSSPSSSETDAPSAPLITFPTILLAARAPVPANSQLTVSFASYQHSLRSHGYSLLSPRAFTRVAAGKAVDGDKSIDGDKTQGDAKDEAPILSLCVAGAPLAAEQVRVCLPALPLANPTLLLLHGAALPSNDHETVLLDAGIPAEAWMPAAAESTESASGKTENVDGKTDERAKNGNDVVVDNNLRAIIEKNQLVPSALMSVAQPLLSPSNGRFLQALRARNLEKADKERIMKMGGEFSARQGYFSLHNELQTMLELASSLEALLNDPHQSSEGVSKTVPMVIGTPLHTDITTFIALAKKHNDKVDQASETSPESLQKLVALGYNIGLKRVIYDTVRNAYEAISIMFKDLSRRWAKDYEIQSVDAHAWVKSLEAAGKPTDVATKWVNDLEQWKKDMTKWETEAKEWDAQAQQWKDAVYQIKELPMLAPKSQGSILETIGKFFAPAIFFFVFMEATSVLCISKAVDENGNRIYNSATVVLVQEVMKLVVSLIGLSFEDPGFVQFRQNLSISGLLKSSIPAALYALNNNIFLVVLTLMNPSVFQLMLNMRVVWTGLIFRFLLGRPVTKKQWVALIVLVIGCSIAQTATTAASTTTNADSLTEDPTNFADFIKSIDPKLLLGFALTMIYTIVSTTAGVVNEVVLKSGESFHSSNVKLYFFGVVFNIIALYHQGSGSGGYFRGWENKIVWVIVTFMAIIGMLVAKIMQKYDNIVKIFCVAAANFVVYTYSVVKDNYPLSAGFVVAFVLVSTAAYMYQQEKNRLDEASKTVINETNAGTVSATVYAKVGDNDEESGQIVASVSDIDDFSDSDFEGHVQGMQLKVLGPRDHGKDE